MELWQRISLLLCTYGFIREIRPSEPFVSEFILGPWRNITEEVLNKEIYPVGTYSYLALLVVVFLVTDYLRYKPLIVLSGVCGIIVYSILLWTTSLAWLQVTQFFYGLYMATEVAYYTYMFAKVDKEHYETVTSWTRAAALAGRFISGVSSQLLFSYEVMDLRDLNYITFSSQIVCIFFALVLPSVERSIYFHREVAAPVKEAIELPKEGKEVEANTEKAPEPKHLNGIQLLWEHTRSAYSKPSVLAWSLWYAASSTAFFQIMSYVQLLWKEIEPDAENLWNGMIEAVLTVLGAVSALAAGKALSGISDTTRSKVLILVPALAAGLQAAAAILAALAEELWLCYTGYIIVGILFHFTITIASFEIARDLIYDSCFGLIFGINTLMALILQTILTLVVISDSGLALDIRTQFIVYAGWYVVLCLASIATWIAVFIMKKRRKRREE